MTLLATLVSAQSQLEKYYPHHWPAGPTYAGIAVAAVLAVVSIVKKVIFLALVLVVVAVGIGLYHHGTINQWLDRGATYKTEITQTNP